MMARRSVQKFGFAPGAEIGAGARSGNPQKGSEDDNDGWIEFEFGRADPAITPFE